MTRYVPVFTPVSAPGRGGVGGLGALTTERGDMPLESIAVRAWISGLTARTVLTQTFRNTFTEPAEATSVEANSAEANSAEATPIEATYVFPLPDRAAVTSLRMEADGRVVDGVLQELGQARRTYDQAVRDGRRASLASEVESGVFSLVVGNILPGERVTVTVEMCGTVPYEDGAAEYRFPLVIAPRYALGGGGSVSPGPVLAPGLPDPVSVLLEVDVEAGALGLADVAASLPVTRTDADGHVLLRLDPGARADQDFVLRLVFGSAAAVTTSAVASPDGTFALTVVPPTALAAPRPRDVVLVLDRSGSMSGWKMTSARRAAERIVESLTSQDRFAVLLFDNVIEQPPGLDGGLVPATDHARSVASAFLATAEARGGTEITAPLLLALGLVGGTAMSERDAVVVLLTDGQVYGADEVLRTVAPLMRSARLHTVGVDLAQNESFLRRLAVLGRGHCTLVSSQEQLETAMEDLHRRFGSPVLTSVEVSGGSAVSPARIPDVFPGAPVTVFGRRSGVLSGQVLYVNALRGDGTSWSATVPVAVSADAATGPLWARERIRELQDSGAARNPDVRAEIIATSLAHGVLSRYTAFVAVDRRVVTDGGDPLEVTQPVEPVAGWDMLGTGAGDAGRPAGRAFRGRRSMARGRPGGPPAPAAPSALPAPAPAAMSMDWMEQEQERAMTVSPQQPAIAPPPPRPADLDTQEGPAGEARRQAYEELLLLRLVADAPPKDIADWLRALAERLAESPNELLRDLVLQITTADFDRPADVTALLHLVTETLESVVYGPAGPPDLSL